MSEYIQEPPFTVKVELTEGCNIRCSFCGIQGIREAAGGPYYFQSLERAERIASEMARLKWNSRIEFTMHGEPTMNPDIVEIIGIFRKHLKKNQIMVTSNGGGLLPDPVKKLNAMFDAGMNVLALDDYQYVKIVPKIRKKFEKDADKITFDIHEHPAELDASPHKRWPRGTRKVIILEDLLYATKGLHSHIANHCGAGAPRDRSTMGKRCARPFRELAIRWNGKVGACCDDWRGELKVGDITTTPLDKVWNGPVFSALRKKLYHGERDIGPCDGCTSRSHRVGLLPDKKGKVELPRPNAADLRVLKRAVSGKPYTLPVLREWEK